MGASQRMDIKKILTFIDLVLPFFVVIGSIFFNAVCLIEPPFIPDKFHWSVSLAIYAALLNVISKVTLIHFQDKLSEIRLVYSIDPDEYLENQSTRVNFSEDGAVVFINIIVSGSPKRILASKINLVFPIGVTIQKTQESHLKYQINKKDNSIIIELNQVFNHNLKKSLNNHSAEISFRLMKKDRVINSPVETRLESKSWNTELNCNELYLLK